MNVIKVLTEGSAFEIMILEMTCREKYLISNYYKYLNIKSEGFLITLFMPRLFTIRYRPNAASTLLYLITDIKPFLVVLMVESKI